MSLITVLDCLSLEPGEVFSGIKGKISMLRTRKTGAGKRGPWSLQAGVLTEGDNEIDIVFWNHPELSAYKGINVFIVAGADKDGNPADLSMELNKSDDERYNGKPQIKVDKRAKISRTGSGLKENNDNPELDEGTPPTEQKKPDPDTALQPIDKAGPVTLNDIDGEVRKYAMRIANTRILAERAADYVVKSYQENHTGTPVRQFTDEAVREIATSLFIQMTRDNVQFKMPGKKLTPIAPPEPPKTAAPTQNSQPAEPPPEV